MDFDSGLIERARLDGSELERLVAAVWPAAYRIAFGILRDRGLAEDAAQEACAAIVRSLSSLKDARVFRSWSYRIVVNEALTLARSMHAEPAGDPSEGAIHSDSADAIDLYNALAALPPVQRAVIILHYYGGFNSFEIARAIGLSAPTVRFHLMQARRTLRKALATEDGTQPLSKEIAANVR